MKTVLLVSIDQIKMRFIAYFNSCLLKYLRSTQKIPEVKFLTVTSNLLRKVLRKLILSANKKLIFKSILLSKINMKIKRILIRER